MRTNGSYIAQRLYIVILCYNLILFIILNSDHVVVFEEGTSKIVKNFKSPLKVLVDFLNLYYSSEDHQNKRGF